jgi:hypothetical protein
MVLTNSSQNNNVGEVDISEQFVTEKMEVGWPWRIFIFAIVVFGLSLFIYFGLRFGYGPYLENSSKELDNKLADLTKTISFEEQEKFVNFYSQLVNLKGVLTNHSFVSNIFQFLERNTIGSVYYTEASVDTSRRSVVLKGFSANLQSLTEQVAVLEKASEVEAVVLNNVGFMGSNTSFELLIVFKQSFFMKPL